MVDSQRGRITPMYLAHHYPHDYERCVLIGQSHVCRRCLVLYPLAMFVMVVTSSMQVVRAIDVFIVVALPLPAVIELVLEQVGVLSYSPRRQIAVTVALAIGLGRAFTIYFADHTSVLFWAIVVLYTAIAGAAVGWRHWNEARIARDR